MKIIMLLLFLVNTNFYYSQNDSIISDLFIVDTTTYNGKTVIVFNDGSWEYEGEYRLVESVESKIIDGCLIIDQRDLYSKNWRNYKTYSLETNCRGASDSILIDVKGAKQPVPAKCNSSFKVRWGRWHNGNDYASQIGTPVKAVWSGKVRYAQMNGGGFGNLIIIRHPNGLETYYAHLSKINVSINQIIDQGTIIGEVGNTGHSTGPHLHFECRFLDNPIDPGSIFGKDKLLLTAASFVSMPPAGKIIRFHDIFVLGEESTVTVIKVQRQRKRKTATNIE